MAQLEIAVGQMGPVPQGNTRESTVERLVDLLREAAHRGCHLIVFPELALTPFFPRAAGDPDDFPEFFEDTMPSQAVEPLFREAARLHVGFCLGFAEKVIDEEEVRYFNASVLVDRRGRIIGKYRKTHIPGLPEAAQGEADQRFEGRTANFEKRYFEPGNLGFPVFKFEGVSIGMAICNDRRWPETYRSLAGNGAEVVLIGYNTMARRRLITGDGSISEPGHLALFHNDLVMQAGAYQNAVWVVAAARAGEEDGGYLIGGSGVIAPTGEIVARALTQSDELVASRIDTSYCELYRRSVWNDAALAPP
ncbi:nitrilase-related carbon-nitrogen hydrolase [Leekyejoonella antrihumi]|uniref:N-carbamoyl-D-amino-acid hydrolase n=1 Tax=Leekyejoonella antrihumi TaxID=1660198 RepID=A0A563DTC3_9MICO|nr:nitrilase-related carbon-nitrogen hydrolase [Leekyejoonella antrihumi]TWP33233.1 N-carbamoyl-D-amino-acid hydrolase [Leekyejoonella antrihumi]